MCICGIYTWAEGGGDGARTLSAGLPGGERDGANKIKLRENEMGHGRYPRASPEERKQETLHAPRLQSRVMYICIYVCMCVYISKYMCMCVHVCMYIFERWYVCVFSAAHLFAAMRSSSSKRAPDTFPCPAAAAMRHGRSRPIYGSYSRTYTRSQPDDTRPQP